ncbi:MAG TPA: dTDP-4-dehydrorhamnose reductase [Anaerolineaceae bacterium]|nr:dTDP-4-dehydrorhamnose reductase [Anaerolineaceae bacterium]
MRILLIGKNGQLGWELQRCLAPLGEVVTYDYPEIDLGKPASLPGLVREVNPQVIVNAAAYTNVDKAESEAELARQINSVAPGVLAEEAKRLNAAFIHYSTDYVFDGRKGAPYVESDAPHPLNVYGQTKLEGEQAVQAVGGAYLVLRTSWVYSMRQGGFVTKVLQWAREQETLRVVDDQVSSPTWARMLAEATALVLAQGRSEPVDYLREKAGLYHLAGSGACSRYEWAQAILELDPKKSEQKVRQLLPAKSRQFPTPAERPLVSVLDCGKFEQAFGLQLPAWRGALKLAINCE